MSRTTNGFVNAIGIPKLSFLVKWPVESWKVISAELILRDNLFYCHTVCILCFHIHLQASILLQVQAVLWPPVTLWLRTPVKLNAAHGCKAGCWGECSELWCLTRPEALSKHHDGISGSWFLLSAQVHLSCSTLGYWTRFTLPYCVVLARRKWCIFPKGLAL